MQEKINEPTEPTTHPLLKALFSPVDASSIVVFRVVFGLVMAFDQLHYTMGVRLVSRYLGPLFLFKYPGFEWVQPGPEWAMRLLFWGLAAMGLCIAVGFFYRVATVLFFLGYSYVFLLDQASYNNHCYLVCLISLALIFVPAHRFSSLDSAIQPGLRKFPMPMWALWLLQFHVAMPYFFGGIAKINADWILRAQPMRLWLTTGGIEPRYQFEIFNQMWTAYVFSWGGLVFDLLIVPLLLFRRTRLPAFVIAVAFHLNNAYMFSIGFFPWLMIGATTVFFAPDWPQRVGLVRRKPAGKKRSPKKGGRSVKGDQPAEAAVLPSRRRWLITTVLVGYVATQCLLPFRHLLYPGNVDWNEEGHRFAWRMKLRDKRGKIQFAIVDSRTQKAQLLEEHEAILTPRQLLKMTHDPEMIRQFGVFMADKLRQKGAKNFEMRVSTSISFNGREPRPMIDPNVDLTAVSQSLWKPSRWILPLEPSQ